MLPAERFLPFLAFQFLIFDKVSEWFATAWMAEFTQGLGFNLADLLTDQIYDAMSDVPEVTKTDVKLVWYPAWTVEKMSRYARIALGIK